MTVKELDLPVKTGAGPRRSPAPEREASATSLVGAGEQRGDAAQYLIRRLERFTRLSAEDREVLNRAAALKVVQLKAHEDIVREGDQPKEVRLFLDGWACRYKMLEDGRRQIMAYFLPGDLCDLNVFILRAMDHSVATITPMTVAEIPAEVIQEITLTRPRITQALWWSSLVDAAIQREWTVSLGQRTAFERIAHLFCELSCRLQVLGLARGDTCDLPLTQTELADTAGLSVVHVNRTLQDMRSAGLITLRGKELTIHDIDRLRQVALYNPNYLHLDRDSGRPDASD